MASATAAERAGEPQPLTPDSFPQSLIRGSWISWLAVAAVSAAGLLLFLGWRPEIKRTIGYIVVGRWLLAGVIYLAAAWCALQLRNARLRMALFACVNVAGLGLFYSPVGGNRRLAVLVAGYLTMIAVHYVLMRRFAKEKDWRMWIAFFSPIAALVVIRYMPSLFDPLWARAPGVIETSMGVFFIGLSYMAFRLSYLVLEVRNGVTPTPNFSQYAAFALFLPTFMIGPISRYQSHWKTIEQPMALPLHQPLFRILIGMVKYFVLGNVVNQLAYQGLLLDGHPHAPVDLAVAAVCYHLYLYCNFSGFCDIAIGGAALLGIRVDENFRNPLLSRNPQEYWTRWHITLSSYMRDVVFSPLSKALVSRWGNANHSIAVTIFIVFLLLGIWHGTGANYAIYGMLQGIGVAAAHYFNIWLKKRGKKAYQAWHENRWIEAGAVAMTFLYMSASLFVFANDLESMKRILSAIQF
jgi:D-alanyl-lipoteichoic acid acyltransferase DltB (MBOAT superfamily)